MGLGLAPVRADRRIEGAALSRGVESLNQSLISMAGIGDAELSGVGAVFALLGWDGSLPSVSCLEFRLLLR